MNVNTKSALWFEVGIRSNKVMENGSDKMVTEKYVFEGVDFLSAFEEAVKYGNTYLRDYSVVTMAIAPYSEYVQREGGNDDDTLYKVKLSLITLDERTGKEKKTAFCLLVLADSIATARDIVNAHMEGSMMDFTIDAIIKTKLIEVVQ